MSTKQMKSQKQREKYKGGQKMYSEIFDRKDRITQKIIQETEYGYQQ